MPHRLTKSMENHKRTNGGLFIVFDDQNEMIVRKKNKKLWTKM